MAAIAKQGFENFAKVIKFILIEYLKRVFDLFLNVT